MPIRDGLTFDRTVPLEDARSREVRHEDDPIRSDNLRHHATRIRSHPDFRPGWRVHPEDRATADRKLDDLDAETPRTARPNDRRRRPRTPRLDAGAVEGLQVVREALARVRGHEDALYRLALRALEQDDPAGTERLYRSLEELPKEEQEPLIAADQELWEELSFARNTDHFPSPLPTDTNTHRTPPHPPSDPRRSSGKVPVGLAPC